MLSLMLAPTLAAALLAPPPALGDSFEAAHVPAGATWIAHLDVAGVRASRMFELAQEHGLDLHDSEYMEVQHELGMDPLMDVEAITIFGAPHDVETPVALVSTNTKVDNALLKLGKHVERSSVELGGLTLSRWDGDGDGPAYSYLARKGDERLLIVSPSKTAVVQTVSVLKGELDSMADDGPDGPDGLGLGDGALLFVSATSAVTRSIPDLEDLEPVARLVRAVRAEIGESGDDVYAKVTLGTNEAKHAGQVAAMIEGGRAMISLAAEMEPEARQLLPLLDGVHVDVFGSDVTLAVQLPLDLIAKLAAGEGHWADVAEPHHDEHDDYTSPPEDDGGSGWR